MERIRRLSDNALLVLSDSTTVQAAPGIHNFKRSREYTYGKVGESVPLSSTIEQKTFNLDFLSVDNSGQDQARISRFFSTDEGFYRLEAPDFGVPSIDFTVVAIDSNVFGNNNSISLTCQSRYGDEVVITSQILYTSTVAAGANFPTWTGSYTNTSQEDKTIRLTIEPTSRVTWKSNVGVRLTKAGTVVLFAIIGRLQNNGVATTWSGLRFALDSYDEITDGFGYINPSISTFFKFIPGETASLKVDSFFSPSVTSTAYKVTIEAMSISQKKN